jgi:plasmid stability protein
MATITLKNIPDELYERLKTVAKLRHRSLNSEIINCLEQSVGRRTMSPEEIRSKAKELREKVKGRISAEEIERSFNEGRP